jgi:hypothetical protein
MGFIVGLALFGAVTFMPLYLQVAKGVSPTASGLQLTPMMAGSLIMSIGSGLLITRTGRYRIFPIIGTVIMAGAMLLLSRLGVETPSWVASLDMLILGCGLGLTMQVLILAAQNAVPPAQVGVATAGATMFRQIGGSIGVALFGAIFTNRLTAEIAAIMPPGVTPPTAVNPAMMEALPEGLRGSFLVAFTNALAPVFMTAAAIAVIAFILSWTLRETPLRGRGPGSRKSDTPPPSAEEVPGLVG